MRLLKYKVNKFRSVKGTDWIETDQQTCFVGVNESGKTNLLLPLWKFNPVDTSITIDLLADYPRDEEIDEDDDERKSEPFIEVLFRLEPKDHDEFRQRYDAFLQSDESEEGEDKSPAKEGEKFILSDFLLIKKDYHSQFSIHLAKENGEEKTDDLKAIDGQCFDALCACIPKFIYYDEYGNLDSDLYLPPIISNLKRIDSLSGKERMQARALKTLFGYLRLGDDEIEALGQETGESHSTAKRQKQLQHASRRLSQKFKEWWSQGDYIFDLRIEGNYFKILVSDSERPSPIELESRSRGLQWFFSFFLVFLAERGDSHYNCILLLDEPGLGLHPHAQMDLVRFFNQLSENNQLIYTTHLPFLVDHNRLDRVKAVYTENGLTRVSNDITKKAIQPVNAAIGIAVSQSLLIGCDIVIVEGLTDQVYLTMIKNHLIARGKITPKREMVFIPAGGTRGLDLVVSVIYGGSSDLPICLLDSDATGKKAQTSLQQGLYSSEPNKVMGTDEFTGKTGSEMEDLIPPDRIIDSFDRLIKTEDGIDNLDKKAPIIPQLKKVAHDNRITLDKGWKVELSKKVKQRFKTEDVDDDLENMWQTLFDKLQQEIIPSGIPFWGVSGAGLKVARLAAFAQMDS